MSLNSNQPTIDSPARNIQIVQRRTNLYLHTYAVLVDPEHGQILVPIHQTMYSRSKYMPHLGLKERIKLIKSLGIRLKIDHLLKGEGDE